jgi:NAD(P)-dependent dehydrogenase (short-subunit alcohol dehydrogenase family)
MASEFSNKVAVITGGGGILCSAMAMALAEKNCKIAVLDIREELAEKVASAINKKGGQALGIGCNVLHVESLKFAHEKMINTFGPCDILMGINKI